MYIDTHTKSSMEKSIYDYLDITSNVLYDLFEYVGSEAQQDKYIDGNKLNSVFDNFSISNLPDTPIEEILL